MYDTTNCRPSGDTNYRLLCDAVERVEGTVKLSRWPHGWGLQVILQPSRRDDTHRAAAVLFPDVGEIDSQAEALLRWLTSCRGDAATDNAG